MIKKILIFLTILALLSTMFLPLLASSVHAATTLPTIPQPDFLPGPSQTADSSGVQGYLLNTGIPNAINMGIGLLGIAAFLAILVSAIQMLTAYGKEDQLNRAKNNLRYSLLGFLITILAYGIVSIVVSIALPNDSGGTTTSFVPVAYAVDVTGDLNTLMPSEKTVIEDQSTGGNVSLPNGDLLSEVIPAAVTNVMYLVAFLIFITLMYGGTLMVIGRGNEEEVTKAKHMILYSAIAMVLVSLGYAIIYGIATLNLNNDSSNSANQVFTDTNNTTGQ